ncbi:ABC transporter ATP-binding protein [Candidatus Woesearchaeota archaeon]|nr:ABC transporter ATP-binding protein [Candidatus Woesearchaeota archaeon]
MDTVIVKNLVKTFSTRNGKIKAVDDVSLSIRKGEIFGLLGVNGAGKSTLINILSGLMTPDSGKIFIFGKDFEKYEEEIKGRFNVATAYYALSHNLTVLQNLKVFAKLYGVRNAEQKINQLLEKFFIFNLRNLRVVTLSSGEKSRLVLVKALLNDPELLFLDECTVGLDPDMAELTREFLQEYNKRTKCTILFTSHYMEEVERICQRIAFMDEGKIVKIGNAKEIIKELEEQKVELHFSANIKKAEEILKELKISYTKEQNKILHFSILNQEKIIFPILEKFIHKNVPFDDLHLKKPTLEEYFIKKSREK